MISRRNLLQTSTGLLALALGASTGFAAAPLQPFQAPGFYRAYLGRYEITAVSDGTIPMDFGAVYANTTPDAVKTAMEAAFRQTPTHTSVNAFVVNTGDRLVMIDAGTGTYLGEHLGHLIRNLEASGYRADDIDDIILTHIHTDHSGGLSVNGQRMFPNATLHVNQREYDFWLDTPTENRPEGVADNYFAEAEESLRSYIDAGVVETFDDDADILPGFGSILRAGHTPGHSSIVIEDAGKTLVFWGDITHGDVMQFDELHVSTEFDVDKGMAAETRAIAMAHAANREYLVAGAHIAFPGIGNVRRDETNYAWAPANYIAIPNRSG